MEDDAQIVMVKNGQLPQDRQQQREERQQRQDTSTVMDDAFDAVRHTALSMFKQRTRDLTRLAHLQNSATQLEARLADVRSAAAQLHAQHAAQDAQSAEEEEHAHAREATLAQLHTGLGQASEEVRVYTQVQASTESVAAQVLDVVKRAAHPDVQLVQLLEQARRRTSDRSPTEFRSATADLRRRAVCVLEKVASMQTAGIVSHEFMRILSVWCNALWIQQPDLSRVRQLAAGILEGDTAAPLLCEVNDGGSRVNELASIVSLGVETSISDAETEAATHECCNGESDDADKTSQQQRSTEEDRCTAWESKVVAVIRRWQDDLDGLLAADVSLSAQCEAAGVCSAAVDAAALKTVQEQWRHLLSDGRDKKGEEEEEEEAAATANVANTARWMRECDRTRRQLRHLQDHITCATAEITAQEGVCASVAELLGETRERACMLEAELDSYGAAWHSAMAASVAQMQACCEVGAQEDAAQDATHATEQRLREAMEQEAACVAAYAARVQGLIASLVARETDLAAAEARIGVAEALRAAKIKVLSQLTDCISAMRVIFDREAGCAEGDSLQQLLLLSATPPDDARLNSMEQQALSLDAVTATSESGNDTALMPSETYMDWDEPRVHAVLDALREGGEEPEQQQQFCESSEGTPLSCCSAIVSAEPALAAVSPDVLSAVVAKLKVATVAYQQEDAEFSRILEDVSREVTLLQSELPLDEE